LVRLLGSLKDETGKILIPGHYENVIPPSEEELALLRSIPFDPEEFKRKYGIKQTLAEGGGAVEHLKTLLFSPTCNISGLQSGWAGRNPE
jgi:hypothetical protein